MLCFIVKSGLLEFDDFIAANRTLFLGKDPAGIDLLHLIYRIYHIKIECTDGTDLLGRTNTADVTLREGLIDRDLCYDVVTACGL